MPTPASEQVDSVGADAINALASSVKAPLNVEGEVVVTPTAAPATATVPQSVQQTPTAPTSTEVDFGEEGMPKLISSPITVKPEKKEETPKEEIPPVVPAPTPEQHQEQQPPATTPQTPARDYSIFSEELATALKKAPNAIFDAVKSHVERTKQIEAEAAELRKGALPPSYYEHPQGYQFDRGYQQAAATYQQAEFERNHWTNQLAELRGGNATKISNLVGFNQQGEPVYNEVPVTPQNAGKLEAGLMNNLASLAQVAQTAQQQATHIRNGFVGQHQQTISYLRQAEDKFFPDMKDVSKHPRKADYDFFTTQFLPPSMRSHPMAAGLGKSYVTILQLQDSVKKLTAENEALKRGRVADGAAGPSPSQMSGAVANNKVAATGAKGDLTLAAFEKLVASDD